MKSLDAEYRVAYLGGHPRFPLTTEPVAGFLRPSTDGLDFDVLGETRERMFRIAWIDVISWDVEGTNTATRETSPGRAAMGALLAGAAGAIVGLASTKERFTSVLAVSTTGGTIGFLVRDTPPTAIVARLQSIAEAAPSYRAVDRPGVRLRWEYTTSGLDALAELGELGWEAVGAWVDAKEDAPRVLLKRRA
jgi:hypothetical protein